MSWILLLDHDRNHRAELRRLLAARGHQVAEAETLAEVEREHELESYGLIVADLRLPDAAGTELIARAGRTPVLVMASEPSVKGAVEAMQLGAAGYVPKPVEPTELLGAVDRSLGPISLRRQVAALRSDVARTYPVAGMIGRSAPMLEVFERIRKVAPTDATVLVRGESGTGKELVARALHEGSSRRDGALVAVNCAAIPDGLIESELFGHEKGAFTGATSAHQGLVEGADGGTLFLDEVGELPLAAQARLLRVVEDSEVRRVGATRARRVNVRLITATHRDLPQLVRDGAFRSDLYFRLRVVEIFLAPLRERGDDVVELAHFLLQRAAARLGRAEMLFTSDALAAIASYPWPGNVRELENAVERAVILCDTGRVTPELMALDDERPRDGGSTAAPLESLEGYFRRFVLEHQHRLSETELARHLGISRKALWERRHRMNLPRPRAR